MANSLVLRPSYWASVSGGKDSLYMLMIILSNPVKYPLDGVVHYELEIDYPFIKDVCNLIKEKCNSLGIKFFSIKPDVSYFTYLDRWGLPWRTTRWCNHPYKISAESNLKKFLKSQGCYLVKYIGICSDEIKRIKVDKYIRYPLVEENIIESDILNWAKHEPIFNSFYLYNKRCGCMYCPCMSLSELAYLYQFYPDNFKFFADLIRIKESKTGKPYFSNVFIDDLEKRIIEKYITPLNQISFDFYPEIYS